MNTAQKIDRSKLVRVFGALADSTRIKLIDLLQERQNICVSELAKELGISVSATSQQMRILEMTGLVNRERMGQRICYQLNSNDEFVKEVVGFIERSNQ